MEIISHPNPDYALKEHLINTKNRALSKYKPPKLKYFDVNVVEDILKIICLSHDFGKSTTYFQKYIRKEKIENLDKEELELLEELDSGTFEDVSLSDEEQERYSSYAKYTKSLQEKKQTTIRFSVSDIATVKAKAKEIGIYIEKIGKIGGDKIKLNGIEIDLDEAKNIYFNRFKQVMKNDIEGLI